MAYSPERHAERMANDPEYREKRRRQLAAAHERRISDPVRAEKRRNQQRAFYAERMSDPDYAAAKRQDSLEYHKERMENDPLYAERRRQNTKAYEARVRLENPEQIRNSKRRAESTRRARKLNQFVEAVDPAVVFERDSGICGICSDPIEGPFHVDHIIPLSKGGEHSYANVQAAHPRCNCTKKDRWPISVESKNF